MKCPRCGHEMTLDTHRKYALNMCYECGYIEGRLIDPEKKGESNFERMKKLNFNEMVVFYAPHPIPGAACFLRKQGSGLMHPTKILRIFQLFSVNACLDARRIRMLSSSHQTRRHRVVSRNVLSEKCRVVRGTKRTDLPNWLNSGCAER